jgi:hypothetical protein
MKGLPILIRLARREADSHRTALAEAERQTGLAEAHLAEHDSQVAAEAALARGQPEEMAAWAGWARASQRRRHGLAHAVTLLRGQEDAAREALRKAFTETKRLEIAQDLAAGAARTLAAKQAERAAEDTELLRRR